MDCCDQWCSDCYSEYIKAMAKRTGGDKNVFIDVSKMTFKCKIPRFIADSHGRPVVAILDCKNNREVHIPLAEWRKKKSAGEL